MASSLGMAAPARRPNIVFILADQFRAQSLPSSGDPDIHAPNLARLAREGVHFNRAYASDPLCSPSRSSLMTGRFPRAAGVWTNDVMLPLSNHCLPQQLKNAGYATGYVGKWHLDGDAKPGFVPPGPHRRGFDYWAGFNRGHEYYSSIYFRDTDKPIHAVGFEPEYQTYLATQFIQQHQSQPFYLYVSYGPPHTPRKPPPWYANYYKPGQFHLPPNVPGNYEQKARHDRVGYYGLCSAIDDEVGRLLQTLDDLDLTRDTIVMFTADHGDMLGSHGLEFKGVPYEESARVPLLLRYPRAVQGARKSDLLVSNVDLMPTLLGLCRTPIPQSVQGINISSQVVSGKGERPESIYQEGKLRTQDEWHMVVKGHDKLVMNVKNEVTHYFNLADDPYEMHDRPDVGAQRADLKKLVLEWHRKAGGEG